MARPKKSLEDKVNDKYPDFAIEVSRLAVEDLEKRIANYSKATSDWELKKEEDAKLNDLKEEVAELNGAYTEPIKELKLKSRYLNQLVKEKGGQ